MNQETLDKQTAALECTIRLIRSDAEGRIAWFNLLAEEYYTEYRRLRLGGKRRIHKSMKLYLGNIPHIERLIQASEIVESAEGQAPII